MRSVHVGWMFVLALVAACEDEALRRVEPSRADAGVRDALARDAELADALAGDAPSPDAGSEDAGPLDATSFEDAAPPDASPSDAAPPLDAEPAPDAIPPEDAAEPLDALPEDAARPDAAPADAGARPCVAIQFDGLLDHVIIPDSPSLNPTGQLTIEAWVRTESGVVNPPWYPNLISKRSTNGIYPAWGLGIWNTLELYAVGDGAWVFGGTVVPFGRWTHVAAVFDQTQIRFFIDGAPAGSALAASMGPANQEPVVLGTLTNNTQNYRGDMAGLRVSSTARYTAAFAPASAWVADADTILLLPMDEGTGAVARDGSGNGNDGTLQGASWIAGCPP